MQAQVEAPPVGSSASWLDVGDPGRLLDPEPWSDVEFAATWSTTSWR
jgi:hypothetical protein